MRWSGVDGLHGSVTLISIYRGSNFIEAQLLAGLLQQCGIEVFLQGAALQGALGELPAMGYLSIMVDEQDQSAAKFLLDAYERGEMAIGDDAEEQ